MVKIGIIDKFKNAKDTLLGGGTLTKESSNEPIADLTSDDSSIPEMPPMSEPEPIETPEIKPSKFTSGLSAEKSRVLKDIDENDIPFEQVSKKKKRKGSDDEILPSKVTYPDDTSEIPPRSVTPPEIPKTETPEIPKTDTPSVDIPETKIPEIPKTDTPVIEEYPPEAIPPEDKMGVKGGVNKILGKFGKRLPTKDELKKSGEEAIKEGESEEKPKTKKKEGTTTEEETITFNAKEREYAILGGYKGSSREQLLSDNKALKAENERIRALILKNDEELDEAIRQSNAFKTETAGLKKLTTDQMNARATQQRLLNADVDKLEKKRDKLQALIDANNKTIKDNNLKISEYDEAVLKGKKISSPRSQIGKKLQKLGEGADIVSSGVYGGKSFGKGDWFGDKGFLSQPFKQANILRSPLEPIKTSSRGLDNITRSTGGSVGRNLMDVSQIRPSKNIAPMGAPGTIYGARQQFDYNIPARKISLLDASGITRANINRDILPSMYDTPKPAQIPLQQYKEVIQEDGSIVQVPVQAQARKSKLFAVSVNRYPSGIKITGVRVRAVGKPVMSKSIMVKPVKNKSAIKNNNRLARGIESVGTVSNSGIAKLKFGDRTSNMNRLIHGVESVGSSKVERVVPDIKIAKKRFGLELLNIKDVGLTVRDPSKKTEFVTIKSMQQDRKSKKSSPLVNLGLTVTGVKLNKNLKKFVIEKKSK